MIIYIKLYWKDCPKVIIELLARHYGDSWRCPIWLLDSKLLTNFRALRQIMAIELLVMRGNHHQETGLR